MILATALSGGCRCLITGDQNLLLLGHYHGIDIISPAPFWHYEQRSNVPVVSASLFSK
jgi:predicted nucleic acid-binding protein